MSQGKYLDRELYKYGRGEAYPFHMPGHKRQAVTPYLENPYLEDITEITGFDNLHHAEGILKEAQEYGAEIFRAKQTYFLINGSTAGILAAVSACTKPGGKLLMARNCHKAAYHAACLRELETVYLYPSWEESLGLNGGICPEDVEAALAADGEIQAVLITSPTYDGILSDVKKIAETVHRYGIPLIVDEAHGAHLPFHDYFPESALYQGGDIVIQSLHKTLPSLTQTAVLHNQSELVSRERLERFLGIYQTSSPSYLLMASITACLRYVEQRGEEEFEKYVCRLDKWRRVLAQMKTLYLPGKELLGQKGIFDLDLSKIIISGEGANIDGPSLHRILREKYGLELEMEAPKYVLALTSLMDTEEGFQRLAEALLEIDSRLMKGYKTKPLSFTDYPQELCSRQILSISQAMESEQEERNLTESRGLISGEFAYLYPPGIPLLVPGEEITEEFIEQAVRWEKEGIRLQGLSDYTQKRIKTVKKR